MQGLGEAWGWGRRGQMRQKSPCQAQTLPGLELGLIILLPGQQRRALPQRTRCGPRGRRGERGSRSRGNGGPRRGGLCGPGPSHGHWPGLLPLQSGDWRGVWSEPSGKEGRGGIEARGSRATCLCRRRQPAKDTGSARLAHVCPRAPAQGRAQEDATCSPAPCAGFLSRQSITRHPARNFYFF